ncbi:MAG: zinc ribbon domain-containing protein [Phycisphaerae bacterium]
MPLYEYVCSVCEHAFEELFRSGASTARVRCPACGSADVRRRLSVFAAREGARPPGATTGAPCARCGDPNGPCSL